MSDPVNFETATPRFALPMLFAGQIQKEVFVNEALARIDSLISCAVVDQVATAPAAPADGLAWLVAGNATGEWATRVGQIAIRQNGGWTYVLPRDGLRVLNCATGQDLRYHGNGWIAPTKPDLPVGGSIADVEARTAIVALIAAMQQAGIFSS